MKLLENVLSLKNEYKNGTKYKTLKICGIKIKKKIGKYGNSICECDLSKYNPDTVADNQNGFLRMRVSHKCNCKCSFCYQQYWSEEDQNATMPNEWLYDYCTPLYERANVILTGGGEITFAKEGYNFCKFLADNYPKVTVSTESNGILYDEKWQNLALENLNMQHFSLNASNPDSFTKHVWKEGGAAIYNKILGNITTLSQKWQDAGMACFTPSISMVVSHENTYDIYDFVKLALKLRLKAAWFFFNQQEGAFNGEESVFTYPETLEPALKELMEMERVLAGKFNLYFRLWLPLNATQKLQAEVESLPIKTLSEKYSELLELAKDRDMIKEWEERNKLREQKGKKLLTIEEDYFASLHNMTKTLINGEKKTICMAPYKSIDIFANGRMDLCGWIKAPMANFKDYIKDGKVDWAQILNIPVFQDMREKVLRDDFSYCMDCCPLHPNNPHLNDIMKYGLKRERP